MAKFSHYWNVHTFQKSMRFLDFVWRTHMPCVVKYLLQGAIGDGSLKENDTYVRQNWRHENSQLRRNNACVFGMDSRLCNLLHWSFRDLPQTVFVIAERFVSQEEGRLTKRNTTVKHTQMIQQNKALDFKPQMAQCICLGITRWAHHLTLLS